MADEGGVRRRRVVPERIDYRRALERIGNFVDDELGNGRAGRPRPDDREWRMQRVKTIRMLNDLREKLDKVCVGSNYGKAVGNSAEILGITATVIAAIMSLRGIPSAQMVMNGGNLVNNAGKLIDGVSNTVESIVSAKYLNDIQEVLREDQRLSLPLAEWLNFSNELDANVQEIFGVSLASEKWNLVMKVFHELSKFSSSVTSFDAAMSLMRQGRYSVHIGNDVKVELLQKFFQQLSGSPRLADRVRLTLSVLSVSTGAIQFFRDGARVYRSLMGTSSPSVVPTFQGGLNIPTAWEVSIFCAFQAISLAISVTSLINATSIIRHGKSKYSDALKQLTHALAWELRQMVDL